jgi:hypothetical protein
MDIQKETQQMVNEAIAKGMEELEKFKEVYAQFRKENNDDFIDLAEERLIKNGTPSIRPWCVACKRPLPDVMPLVLISGKRELHFFDGDYFKARYFNHSVSYRICLHCQQTHPKVI